MKAQIKSKIIDSAITLLMVTPKASMDQIAAAAKVGRATLFRYFHNRGELMIEIVIHAYRECDHVLEPIIQSDEPSEKKLQRAVTELIPHGADYHFLIKEPPPKDDPRLETLDMRYLEHWQQIIRQLKEERIIDSNISIQWAARSLDHLIFAAWEAVFYGEIAPCDTAELVVRSFLKGIQHEEYSRR